MKAAVLQAACRSGDAKPAFRIVDIAGMIEERTGVRYSNSGAHWLMQTTDWREVARLVMKLDPDRDPQRVHAAWTSHLDRARWMTTNGYHAYLTDREQPR